MIHSKLFYPVNLVHIFPPPFFRQRLYKLDSGGHGSQVKSNSYTTGEFIVQPITKCVSETEEVNALMIVPFAVSDFPIIASPVSAGWENQRALNFTVPVSCSATIIRSSVHIRAITLGCFGSSAI